MYFIITVRAEDETRVFYPENSNCLIRGGAVRVIQTVDYVPSRLSGLDVGNIVGGIFK